MKICYHLAQFFDGSKYQQMHIDGQHLRPPILAILLETIEREIFCQIAIASFHHIFLVKNCTVFHQFVVHAGTPVIQ